MRTTRLASPRPPPTSSRGNKRNWHSRLGSRNARSVGITSRCDMMTRGDEISSPPIKVNRPLLTRALNARRLRESNNIIDYVSHGGLYVRMLKEGDLSIAEFRSLRGREGSWYGKRRVILYGLFCENAERGEFF